MIEIVTSSIADEPICKIANFIESLIRSLKSKLSSIPKLEGDDLAGNYYKNLKEKTLGCDEFCPMCRR